MNREEKLYDRTPFVRESLSTRDCMLLVLLSLLPCVGTAIYFYGMKALLMMLISMASAVVSEALCCLIFRRKQTVGDFSAVVSGLIGALILPVTVPLWFPAAAAAFSMMIVKAVFGGIGRNFVNPAMTGKLALTLLFYEAMQDFGTGAAGDAVQMADLLTGERAELMEILLGRAAGGIGTTSAVNVLIGAMVLLLTGVVSITIPAACLAGLVLTLILFGGYGLDPYRLTVNLIGGGTLFTAFFMATDYTTSPVTRLGRVFYGVLLGVLIAVLRITGIAGIGENACVFALPAVNLTARLLDRITMPRPFGIRNARRTIRYDQEADDSEIEVEYLDTEREMDDSGREGRETILLGLRPAGPEDSDFLLELRNDPVTRSNSFQTEEIRREDHENWYARALADPDTAIYLLTSVIDDEEYRFGQLRLHFEGGAAVISYTIAPRFRGHGLGRELLRLAEDAARLRPETTMLIGEVKKQNEASKKSFRSLDYQESELGDHLLYRKSLPTVV
ncbi:MAG: GNAT family N-acetyltransferase [Lachnospiraceae bacterium]|nr:GNAT family N-acetyltransferase [Lachnospiraceae bacterium]